MKYLRVERESKNVTLCRQNQIAPCQLGLINQQVESKILICSGESDLPSQNDWEANHHGSILHFLALKIGLVNLLDDQMNTIASANFVTFYFVLFYFNL